MNFNPRAPCGARRRGQTVGLLQRISTHAPLAGRDGKIFSTDRTEQAFQPTRPLRGATASAAGHDAADDISIHAPLAGRDSLRTALFC